MVSTLSLGDYDFERVCTLEVERDQEGNIIEHLPQNRYSKAETTPLNRYGSGPFVRFKISSRLQRCGVYVLTVNEVPKYVGEAANLSKRYNMGYGNISPRNCFKGGQETNCRLNNAIFREVSQGSEVALWFYPTADYKAVELELRDEHRFEWNKV